MALTCGFPLIVDTMIFRNVSILTSSDPFSNAERSSEVGGYSAADSNTIVWHDGSEEDIVDDGECTCEVQTFSLGAVGILGDAPRRVGLL